MTLARDPLAPARGDDVTAVGRAVARRLRVGGALLLACGDPATAGDLAAGLAESCGVAVRALPGREPDAVRGLVRPGDVVVLVDDGSDRAVQRLARRGAPGGQTVVRLSTGDAPDDGAGDHVLGAVGDPSSFLAALGRAIAAALAAPDGDEVPVCTDEVCLTCSDEARLVEVLEVAGTTARVLDAGREGSVDTCVVGDVARGDLLLAHAGLALANVTRGDGL